MKNEMYKHMNFLFKQVHKGICCESQSKLLTIGFEKSIVSKNQNVLGCIGIIYIPTHTHVCSITIDV